MIPFVYCSTNPEQKEIGEMICDSVGFEGYPLYDTACMEGEGEGATYLEGELKKIKGNKIAILYSNAIKQILEVLGDRQCTLFGNDFLIDAETDHLRVVSNNELAGAIDGETLVLPFFSSKPTEREHYWKYDSRMEIRVLITGEGFAHTPYFSIFRGLETSGINFRLIINNPTNYPLHGHQLTNDDIRELLPEDSRITFISSFPPQAADIVIVPSFHQGIKMHLALQANALVIAQRSRASLDLRSRYGCVIDCDLSNPFQVGDAFRELKDSSNAFLKLMTGVVAYNEMRSPERIRALYEPIFGSKKRMKRATPSGDTINVFLMARNNEDTIGATLAGFKTMERRLSHYSFQYYIYENDSTDDTPELIRDFFSHSNGKFLCEKLGKKHWAGNSDPRRMLDLASYRNKMVELCETWEDSTYSFIVDSEIAFPSTIMEDQINLLQSRKDSVMITPYGQPLHSSGYYDEFAYRGISGEPVPTDATTPFEAESAFSGFACILSTALQNCHWDCTGSESEHIHFCNMVNKYGKILVDPNVEVRWKK
jgi:hypothetical protein